MAVGSIGAGLGLLAYGGGERCGNGPCISCDDASVLTGNRAEDLINRPTHLADELPRPNMQASCRAYMQGRTCDRRTNTAPS